MNFKALRDEVKLRIKDPSFTDPEIDGLLNRCLREVAGGRVFISDREGIKGDTVSPPIPDLMTELTVTQGAVNYITLPGTFQRDLISVEHQGEPVEIIGDFMVFKRDTRGEQPSQYIRACCLVGKKLYLSPGGAEGDEIELIFYSLPAVMTEDTDSPDVIDEPYHDGLFINYACMKCFEQIESDETGRTPETDKYRGLFERGFAEYVASLGGYQGEAFFL